MDATGAAKARAHAGGGEIPSCLPKNDFADAGETLDEAFLFQLDSRAATRAQPSRSPVVLISGAGLPSGCQSAGHIRPERSARTHAQGLAHAAATLIGARDAVNDRAFGVRG